MLNYKINTNLSVRKISDEYFILDRDTGLVHTFNDSGTFLWEKISTNIPYDNLIDELMNEYECTQETAQSDLSEFFNSLDSKKLITIQA